MQSEGKTELSSLTFWLPAAEICVRLFGYQIELCMWWMVKERNEKLNKSKIRYKMMIGWIIIVKMDQLNFSGGKMSDCQDVPWESYQHRESIIQIVCLCSTSPFLCVFVFAAKNCTNAHVFRLPIETDIFWRSNSIPAFHNTLNTIIMHAWSHFNGVLTNEFMIV